MTVTPSPARAVVFVLLASTTVLAGGERSRGPQPTEQILALVDQGLYDQSESLAQASLQAIRNRAGPDSLEVAVATDLLVRVLILNGKATTERARSLAAETVRQKQSALGGDHPELIPSLLNLSAVLAADGEHVRAVEAAQRAVAASEKHQVDSAMLADSLDHLGAALDGASRYDEALASLNRSLAVKESTLSPADAEVAHTLELIAWTLQRKGDYQRAGSAIRRAIGLREAGNIRHPSYANALNILNLQLWFEGKLTEAADIGGRAVEVAELTLHSSHPTLARALNFKAFALMDLGFLADARVLFEQAFVVAERALGPMHYDMWAYLNDLALTSLYMGDYVNARIVFERALKAAQAKVALWDDRVATTINNLAVVDRHLGDYESAERRHRQAINIWERVFSRTHPFVARALMRLAEVYRDQGLHRQALPLLERALAIREMRLGPEHRDVATTLIELAATLRELQDLSRAQAIATRALRIWERAGSPEQGPGFATIPVVYARLHRDLGNYAVAKQYYERALEIQSRVVSRSHPIFAETQSELAETLAALGNHQDAVREASDAETTGRDHQRMMLRYLPERQSLAYAARRGGTLDLLLSLSTVSGQALEPALESLIRGRALIMDEMAARRIQTGAADPESQRLHAEFVAVQQRLANQLVRGAVNREPTAYAAAVAQTRRESEAAERRLAEWSAGLRQASSSQHVGLKEVRAALPPASTLVSFIRYERAPWNDAAIARRSPTWRPIPSYVALVLVSDQPVAAVPLGSADTIDRGVTRWRRDILAEMDRTPISPSGPASRSSGSALRKLIWDPIAPHLGRAKQVLIVADGSLHLVPFAALPVGRDAYLLEEAPTIHYLSTERDLVERMREADAPRNTAGLLAVGAPAFDDANLTAAPNRARAQSPPTPKLPARGPTSDCSGFENVRFHQLSGALQEATDIAALWHAQRSGQSKESARLLTGAEASERAFKRDAPGRRVLHLATHGFFLGPDCTLSTSGQRGIGGLVTTSGRKPAMARRENPLHLSGLALAGANRRASAAPQEDDGVLTAEEVVSLNLDGVEWAVLSACDTGVGVVHAGEGVFGLRRAFQVAGVRTVIMSLWSVDDQAARAWMQALYEGRLRDRLSTAEAVRAASLALLRDRRARGQSTHPFYWAAFVAVGDSR